MQIASENSGDGGQICATVRVPNVAFIDDAKMNSNWISPFINPGAR
jgi:hypothetical protein